MSPSSDDNENIDISVDDLKDEPYIEAEHCTHCKKQTDELFTYKEGFVCMHCLPKLLHLATKNYIEKQMEDRADLVISSALLSQNVLHILELDVDISEFEDITQKYVKLQQIAKDLPYMIKKERGNVHISV